MEYPMKSSSSKSTSQWILAYENMLVHVSSLISDLRSNHEPRFYERIALAKQKVAKFQELSEHEAEKIASYVQRDFQDAVHFMQTTNQRFQDWLAFDWQLIEIKLFEMCSEVADNSVLEWRQLRQQYPLGISRYRAGEIVGIGSLCCKACGQVVKFIKISRIPPCPKCHQSEFQRLNFHSK